MFYECHTNVNFKLNILSIYVFYECHMIVIILNWTFYSYVFDDCHTNVNVLLISYKYWYPTNVAQLSAPETSLKDVSKPYIKLY